MDLSSLAWLKVTYNQEDLTLQKVILTQPDPGKHHINTDVLALAGESWRHGGRASRASSSGKALFTICRPGHLSAAHKSQNHEKSSDKQNTVGERYECGQWHGDQEGGKHFLLPGCCPSLRLLPTTKPRGTRDQLLAPIIITNNSSTQQPSLFC